MKLEAFQKGRYYAMEYGTGDWGIFCDLQHPKYTAEATHDITMTVRSRALAEEIIDKLNEWNADIYRISAQSYSYKDSMERIKQWDEDAKGRQES